MGRNRRWSSAVAIPTKTIVRVQAYNRIWARVIRASFPEEAGGNTEEASERMPSEQAAPTQPTTRDRSSGVSATSRATESAIPGHARPSTWLSTWATRPGVAACR